MSITTGTKLGQYEVQDFIGQGAMGLVFRAYHSQLERTGAVKVLQAIAPDAGTTARFRHEAQAIAQLRHPNIVNVYDFGEYQGTPYMIVEYVPGGSLADRLNSGQVETTQALKYLRGIAAGLDYAHGIGIIHRDVKPANVLLEKDNTPVLADFGLAKLVQGSSLKSVSGVTTGTPAYMAPEQVTGDAVGPAADRYSLATIAYEMLAGVIPFDGSGLMEILYAQVHREPPPPSAHNSSLSSYVDEVILRGLAKEPALRWESCTAFVDALEAALAKKPKPAAAKTMVMTAGAVSTIPLKKAVAAAAVAVPAVADYGIPSETWAIPYPAPSARWDTRRPLAIWAAAALVLLLILGVIGYVATHPTPTITLSASTVTAGDTVVVTTAHVPANQIGTIQLHSTVRDFPFLADANGYASTDILIPLDIGSGDHTVKICWASACHASATLHVVNPAALESPSPGATPSTTPGASPQPIPTPGRSPVPTAAPTHRPGPSPIPTPRATPSPSPTPRPLPTPTPSASITLVSVSATGNTTVVFHYFYAGTANIFVCQNSAIAGQPATCQAAPGNPRSVAPGASITVTFKTPAGIKPTAPLVAGQAYLVANSLKSNSVNVGP